MMRRFRLLTTKNIPRPVKIRQIFYISALRALLSITRISIANPKTFFLPVVIVFLYRMFLIKLL
jgi:hypothetical protein